MSLKDFSERYKSGHCTQKNMKGDNPMMPFVPDTGCFQHPSASTKGKGNKAKVVCSQGVQCREERIYAKVSQWHWPDAGDFHHNVLECSDAQINRSMETFSQLALTLLLPHRSCDDLEDPNEETFPYTHKLREVYEEDKAIRQAGGEPRLFTESNTKFLQNIQNAAHNSLRYKIKTDDLGAQTIPFETEETCNLRGDTQEDDNGEEDPLTKLAYEDFLDHLESEFDRPVYDDDEEYLIPSLKDFTFKHIRNTGDDKCGYKKDIDLPNVAFPTYDFVETTTLQQEQERRGRKRKRQEQQRKNTA